jgi:hypothetical protein
MRLDESRPPKGELAQEEERDMAKQGKLLPARRQRDEPRDEDSVLLRSAESIGRVIGSLQRQLDGARSRVSELAGKPDGSAGASSNGRGTTRKAKPRVKAAATKATKKTTKRTRKSVKNVRPKSY